MSGSAGASPSRKAQPPLPPDDASDQMADYIQSPVSRKPTIDSLLPPGAEEEPEPPPVGLAPILAEFMAPQVGPRGSAGLRPPMIETNTVRAARQAISAEEKEQRRFWRNAIVFGVCLVVLMAVCFLLAR